MVVTIALLTNNTNDSKLRQCGVSMINKFAHNIPLNWGIFQIDINREGCSARQKFPVSVEMRLKGLKHGWKIFNRISTACG
jgi:hypothetical protein